jgi:threonine dehydratase
MTIQKAPAYAISFADIKTAAERIHGHVLRTPTTAALDLGDAIGATLFVKHETLQPTASFKVRGAANKLLMLTPSDRARGVIAMSAGNHAQAVAYHAQRLGIPATIVMPLATPLVKVENTRHHGANVVLHGETLLDSAAKAQEIAQVRNLVFVHPYDDAAIMAGQGTIALEMLTDMPDLDVLVVPIGGGGLISGIAIAARAMRPDIQIIGVEAALYPAFHNIISNDALPVGGPTLAEGIAVKTVGVLPLPIVRELVDDIILVSETQIERAVYAFATHHRALAEGAAAAGLAAVMAFPERFAGRKVGLVLCGGNIDARLLSAVMVRELERQERIVSFRISTQDRPGLLGLIATRVGELGANILEVRHGRLFLDVPAKGVTVDLTIETRDAAHASLVLKTLADEGFCPRIIGALGLSEPAL